MGIQVSWDPQPGFWRLAAHGALSIADAADLLEEHDWQGKLRFLWDLRRLEKGPETIDEIREAVDLTESNRDLSLGSRTAILVTGDLRFGLGRMFTALAEQIEGEYQVFKDEAEAIDWLYAGAIEA